MILTDITKSRINRPDSTIYDVKKSLIFHIKGTTTTNDGYYEYRLHTVGKAHFNLKCLICRKYLNIKHKNIEVVPHENKPNRWKIGSDVREEDLRDKSNYEEIFHQHTKRCRVTCVAQHIKNCSYSKFRPNKRRFRTDIVRQSLKFQGDTPNEIFKSVSRIPNVLPPAIDPEIHLN